MTLSCSRLPSKGHLLGPHLQSASAGGGVPVTSVDWADDSQHPFPPMLPQPQFSETKLGGLELSVLGGTRDPCDLVLVYSDWLEGEHMTLVGPVKGTLKTCAGP